MASWTHKNWIQILSKTLIYNHILVQVRLFLLHSGACFVTLTRMTMILPVTLRDKSQNLKNLRANGAVPAVVYGPKQEAVSLIIDAKVFSKTLSEAGESTIISLEGMAEETEVLIKRVEFDTLKNTVHHVDFYAIERGKEMTTKVAIRYEGEEDAEANKIGVINKVLHEVEVTCLPRNLPSELVVNISSLTNLEDKILVKDIKLEAGVRIEAEPDDLVVGVSAIAEEVEQEVEEVSMDSIEVEQKGKDSGEEKAEEGA